MPVGEVTKFERFYREAAGLDVDKRDIRRHGDFVARKTYDMLVAAQSAAGANDRDLIEPRDLPITRGLQQLIDEFRKLNQAIEISPIFDEVQGRPQLEMSLSEQTDARLPLVAGGLSLGLARAFTIVDTTLRNPQTEHWERAFRLFDLLL
ncbi:MAG TPA: DUF1931 family protein [Candidatus Dormibacteraeota bacterium]|jgi:hypothetical protein|nr:DUF1931 family protein [Candidatus Dormibacteraeota bacterium]